MQDKAGILFVMYHRLLILLLLLSLPPSTTMARDAAHLTPAFGLNRLAANIADRPAPLRFDLARIAITELATAYADETEHAHQDMRGHTRQYKLSTWATAVAALAVKYAALAKTLTPTTPIQISTGLGRNLQLMIDGQLLVVSSPRMNEQTAFEQRIITRFCALNRCEGLLDEPDRTTAAKVSNESATPQWSFSQQTGPVCGTSDGLEFQFLNADNLSRKRETCARVVTELNTLAAALTKDMANGIRVHWNQLVIHPLPDGDEQVILNGEGDYLRLTLPTLAARPKLFAVVRPWLAAKVKGSRYPLVVLHAGQLLAAPGQRLE